MPLRSHDQTKTLSQRFTEGGIAAIRAEIEAECEAKYMDSLEAVQKSHQATCDWLRQMNDALRADLQKRAVNGEYMQHLESRFVDMCKKIDYVKKFIDSRHLAGFISFPTQEILKIIGGN